MSDPLKKDRLTEILKELAAQFFQIESSGTSMITVTNCAVKENTRGAVIYISIIPDNKEKEALAFAKRKRSDFKEYIKSHSRLRFIPFIDFELDMGEKNRQHIDKLLS